MKYKLLALIIICATWLDLLIIYNEWYFPNYIIASWVLVWLVVWLVTKNFIDSIGWIFIVSISEDFLFLASEALMGIRAWYPLYSHSWVDSATGGLFGFMGYDWLGLPSSYFIGLIGGVLILNRKYILKGVVWLASKTISEGYIEYEYQRYFNKTLR